MAQKISDSISDQKAEEAVSAAKLIDDSAKNLLEKIYKATQAEAMKTRDITEYARALKMLKEVTQDTRTVNNHVNIIYGSNGEDYGI